MTKARLILVGYGGFGREVAAWIAASNMPFDVIGHIDDEKSGPRVIGNIVDHEPLGDCYYLTCFGDGKSRMTVRARLEQRGARFATVVAPQVIHASPLTQSRNNLFLGYCSVSNNVSLGTDVLIQSAACIGHDVEIGNGVTVSALVFIGGGASLGDFCTVHPHAVILPKVTIGEGAIVGAGSVVIKNVRANTTVFGSPAREIAVRADHD